MSGTTLKKDQISLILDRQEKTTSLFCACSAAVLILLFIIVILTGLVYNNQNKLNGSLLPISAAPKAVTLKTDFLNKCTFLCDKNLCLDKFDTEECVINSSDTKEKCETKEYCYSNCVEFYLGKVEQQCYKT